MTASAELTRQTDLLLGQCYHNLGDPDLQLAVFRRAVADSPSWTPALLGRASALLAVGKTDEALVDYSDLVKQSPHVLEARLQAVRLLIFRTLQLPADQRDWSTAETLLKETPEDQQKSADVRLARIDLLIARNRLSEAHEQLDQAREAEPKEVRYWLVLARLADREAGKDAAKDPTKSLEVLDRAELGLRKASGGSLADSVLVDLRLARAGRILRLAPEEAVKRLRPLEEGADALDAPERAAPPGGTYGGLPASRRRGRRPPAVQTGPCVIANRHRADAAAVRPVLRDRRRGRLERAGERPGGRHSGPRGDGRCDVALLRGDAADPASPRQAGRTPPG